MKENPIVPIRVTTSPDGQRWINAQDLIDWVDASILDRSQSPETARIALEFSAKLGQMAHE